MKIKYAIFYLCLLNINLLLSMDSNSQDKSKLEEEFIEAAKQGDIKKVKEIIDLGININCISKDYNSKNHNYTALNRAACWNKVDVVNLLISSGADINFKCSIGKTPLMDAVTGNAKDTLKLLINAGADLNAQDYCGQTALVEAARWSALDLNIMKILLDAGAKINLGDDQGRTPIFFAILCNQTGFNGNNRRNIKFLLESDDIDLRIKDDFNKTVFNYAKDLHLYETLEMLEKKRDNLVPSLYESINSNNIVKFKKLLKFVHINMCDKDLNNLLHIAAIKNKPEIFMLILCIRPKLIGHNNKDNKNPLQMNPSIATCLYEALKK